MSKLLDRLAKNSVVKPEILKNSRFFVNKLVIPTRLPILNLALGGSLDSGIHSGIVQIAAPPKHFKSNLMIELVASFLDYHKNDEEAAIVFYDSEGGTTPEYFEAAGVDTSKIQHRMVSSIEELTSDIANLCNDIVLGDKVLICIDSIGMLSSLKAIKDAMEENHVVNMTEAKQLKTMFKIITSQSVVKKIPIVLINHSYQTMDKFAKEVAAGGRASQYASNSLFFVTKADDKEGDEKLGFRFTLVAALSRHVKQGSKFPINVHYNHGLRKYSGIFDLALELGFIKEATQGYYWKDAEQTQKTRRKAIERDKTFMDGLLNNDKFKLAVENHYRMDAIVSAEPEVILDDEELDIIEEAETIVKEYKLKNKKQ
jgi:RecA/RadA recombinase